LAAIWYRKSEYAFFCRKHKLKYVCSHIWDDKDFFKYEPEKWDIALSNPPFSMKLKVFNRLNELGKPWAMLTNIMCLNYQEIGYYFSDHPCQMLIVDKRVSFNSNPSSFNSSYICGCNFLPSDLIFTHIKNNNALANYLPSRMQKNRRTK
jgi:hypothetical protein